MTLTQEFDTIAAVSTPMGEGAIAIVRLSGSDAIPIADRLFRGASHLTDVSSHTIHYGHLSDIDEVMASVFRAPRTFTREDMVEINCHGGVAVTQAVLQALLSAGARLAEPGEFTKRAFLNGRIDLAEAEAVMDVIRAKTDSAAAVAVKQLDGQLSHQIAAVRQKMLETLAAVEVNIDYPEYDDAEEMTSSRVRADVVQFRQTLGQLLSTATRGKILREGLKTAIVGRPNVGKSSLLNALLREEKAIVTDVAGTTRDVISENASIGGIPLVLMDTAGIHETLDKVEAIGVKRSTAAISDADLILLVLDGSAEPTAEDQALLELTADLTRLIILNKADLPRIVSYDGALEISASDGTGLDSLENAIRQLFFDGQLSDSSAATATSRFSDLASMDNVASKTSGGLRFAEAGSSAASDALLSNARHIALVNQARAALDTALDGLDSGLPVDLVQNDLRESWQLLGEIVGDTAPDALINQLFAQFCLGK